MKKEVEKVNEFRYFGMYMRDGSMKDDVNYETDGLKTVGGELRRLWRKSVSM